MFGLFGNKIKNESHRRAVNWWKNLTITGIKENSRPCHFCKKEVPRMKGYLFSTDTILSNDKYMDTEIKKLEARGIESEKAQELVWHKVETTYDDWLVCEKCLDDNFI